MNRTMLAMSLVLAVAMGLGCKKDSAEKERPSAAEKAPHADGGHAKGDGQSHHEGDGHDHGDHAEGDGHDHGDHAHGDGHDHGGGHGEEIKLGTVSIGDLQVAASQGHGEVKPGKESHLVVKLPYNDNGATTVRAWLGTKNRTLSFVGKGEYAASREDYNVHAIAPDPLPANVMWWIEIEKPGGVKLAGSIKPLVE